MEKIKRKRRISRKKLVPVKWIGTFLCTIGIALTSFNVYPLNIFVMFVGTGIWFGVGYLQRDWPLSAGELISLVLYGSGILMFLWRLL
jgi:predicted anti-sigma-YlaC factor YlaD